MADARKKGTTKLMVVTTDFHNFFITVKKRKFPINFMYISHRNLTMLPHYLWEVTSSNLSQIWKKMQTNNVT